MFHIWPLVLVGSQQNLCLCFCQRLPPSLNLQDDGVPVAQWEGAGAAKPAAQAGPAVRLHLCCGRGGLQGPQSCAGSLQRLLPHPLPWPERCGASGHQQRSRWVFRRSNHHEACLKQWWMCSSLQCNQTCFIVDCRCRFGSGPRVHVHSQAEFKSTECRRRAGCCQLSTDARNCKRLLCVPVNGKSSSVPHNAGFGCRWVHIFTGCVNT